jgi:hypothetical protein
MDIPMHVIKQVRNNRDRSPELAQCLLEMQYNRRFARTRVLHDIQGEQKKKVRKDYAKAIKAIDKYRFGEYYQSKNERLKNLTLSSEELLQEVLASVCVGEGEQPIQASASRMTKHLGYDNIMDGIKTASELIGLVGMKTKHLYWLVMPEEAESGTICTESILELSDETLEWIDKTLYQPPMVVKPRHVTGKYNMDTSHISYKSSLLLGQHTHHTQKLAYDVINILNQIPLALDMDIVEFEEVPNNELETPEQKEQFEKLVRDSIDIYNEVLSFKNKFYLTWKYDFRGRVYSQGYHINIQSTDYKKALISLAKKEIIV